GPFVTDNKQLIQSNAFEIDRRQTLSGPARLTSLSRNNKVGKDNKTAHDDYDDQTENGAAIIWMCVHDNSSPSIRANRSPRLYRHGPERFRIKPMQLSMEIVPPCPIDTARLSWRSKPATALASKWQAMMPMPSFALGSSSSSHTDTWPWPQPAME
ncbi:MAG: hypothetical protein WAO14_01615, partial [Pseudolabrys sp.]